MNENEVKIDYHGLLNQLADKVITDFVGTIIPDEKTKKLIVGFMSVHRKYGIDATTSFQIMQELAELVKEDDK